jgi:hypothetical protein
MFGKPGEQDFPIENGTELLFRKQFLEYWRGIERTYQIGG